MTEPQGILLSFGDRKVAILGNPSPIEGEAAYVILRPLLVPWVDGEKPQFDDTALSAFMTFKRAEDLDVVIAGLQSLRDKL